MSYQLDYLTVLRALLLPVDITFALLILCVPLVTITIAWKTIRKSRLLKLTVAATVIIPLVAIPLVGLGATGSGWRLKSDMLELKAWPVSEALDLKSAQIELVEAGGMWQPVLRTSGYGSPGLSTGVFKLRNGREATVFRHLSSSKILLLKSNERYYLLMHPGVEDLYRELRSRGIQGNVR